jgi:hypothetical protein
MLDPLSQRLLRLAGLLGVLLVLVLVNSLVNSGDDEPSTSAATTAPPTSTAGPSTPGTPEPAPDPAPDPDPKNAKPAKDPVAAAAERLEKDTGGRMSLYAIYSSPTLPAPLVAKGGGAYNVKSKRSRVTLDVKNPITGEPIRTILINDDEVEYEGGDSIAGDLPPGKSWVRTEDGAGEEASDFSFDESMEMLSTSGTKLIGRESINGKMTRHYRGEITISELIKYLRKKGKEAKADAYQRIRGSTPTQILAEGWIDDQNLLRRMRMVMPAPGDPGEPPITVDMRMDFFAFGSEPDIQLPDPDTVVEGPLEDDDEGASEPAPVS